MLSNDDQVKFELSKLNKLEVISNKIIKSHGLHEGVSAYEIEYIAREMLHMVYMIKILYNNKNKIINKKGVGSEPVSTIVNNEIPSSYIEQVEKIKDKLKEDFMKNKEPLINRIINKIKGK